ncbi:MAG: hypothetical protein JNL11_03155 [Bdellovibrionaceae bacterium]|nr:hypothetical protein [Pseudobdellovibrionaceae bacterium]
MKLKQILVLTLAVVFFTACGKKKEAAQQVATPQTVETAAPGPTISSDEAKKRAEADKKAQDEANKKRVSRGQHTGDKKVGTKGTKSSAGSSRGVSDGRDDNFTTGLALTGGASKSGMLFTGSAGDGIISQLLEDEKIKLAEKQNRNAVLAASIWDMAYLIDNQGQIHLDVELKKGNGLTKVQAKTLYTAGQEMSIVSNQSSASGIELRAECLDASARAAQCSNLLVTLIQNDAEAKAILRQTYADIWYEHEKIKSANEYATLVQFFNNAKWDVETANKVSTAYMNTFEVVNGKAGFKVVVTGKRNQLIAFSANLVVKKNSLDPSTAVDKETQFRDIDLWMGRIASKDLAFSRSISDARLVQNSTKGQITIDMMVSSAGTGTKNSFTLRFTRIPVPAVL